MSESIRTYVRNTVWDRDGFKWTVIESTTFNTCNAIRNVNGSQTCTIGENTTFNTCNAIWNRYG